MSQQSNDTKNGTINAIAVRTAKEGPMQLIDSANVAVAGGLEGDLPTSPRRGVTFLSEEQWHETISELNVDIPWHTRRANVLVSGLKLGDTIGRVYEIGEVRIRIEGETEPCGLMDKLQPGLKDALKPDCRAGVHGRVLQAGAISVGDTIRVLPQEADVHV